MIVASFLDRVIHRNPQKRLARLKESLAEKEREVELLRSRISELHSQIEAANGRRRDAA
jgi:SMC interacting uncharacterized protein involved in chromosome segregation